MLTDDRLRTLARASSMYAQFGDERSTGPWDPRIRDLALDALGRPDDDTVISTAIDALVREDRNLRVAGLRVLWWYRDDPRVAPAVLQASRDSARRVRRTAVGMLAHFIDQAGVAERLREVIDDPAEISKIAVTALMSLMSHAVRPLPDVVQRSVADLLSADAHRERILMVLLSQPVDDSSRDLLHEIVRTGSKGEAVAATRALCGLRVTNLAHVPVDQRKRVVATCEPVDLSWVSSRAYRQTSLFWVPA